MDTLDFSALSDDQIVTLIRAALREVADRSPGCQDAAKAAVLDEAERVRIIQNATEQEMAALRASERERIAKAARDRVRAEQEERELQLRTAQAKAKAAQAAAASRASGERGRAWLTRAAGLVSQSPAGITLLVTNTKFGRRVLINEGADRYSHEHLVDYNTATLRISTTRALVAVKPRLVEFCAEFAAFYTRDLALIGAEQDWS